VLALVASAGLVLYLYVAVTGRFDGRLWQLPARIYSDSLDVESGLTLTIADLTDRLDRNGYANSGDDRPSSPGQYRARRSSVELYRRGFDTGSGEAPARRIRIRFAGRKVAAVEDERGRRLAGVELEPELLATVYGRRQEERRLIQFDDLPEPFLNAVLAAEDVRYYGHAGLDLRGILRAAAANLRHGRIVQGGSTITQQTVKNLYLDQRRTWWRKIREAAMALILDAKYPKDRILEVYVNEVYLGQRGPVAICGVQAASRFYFGRDLSDLSLGEWALLAGLIRSPGTYNPFRHPERATARRDQVLDDMQRLGFVTRAEADAARDESLLLASGRLGFGQAPYAVDFVRAELLRLHGDRTLREDGLRVYTTIDTGLQRHADDALAAGLARLDRAGREEPPLQAAIVATRKSSGAILAVVGGRDYESSQFNRAVQASRQPGSCFKPFVYAAGFELTLEGQQEGLTPATLLEDAPLEREAAGGVWRPSNYDGEFRGAVTARRALEESLNVPTVRAAERVGLERVIETARACGLRSPLSPLPSMALGTEEVTPLELAESYATLGRGGEHIPSWIVRFIVDGEGRRLYAANPQRRRAISPQAAHLIGDLLEGVVERGTARSAAAHGLRGRAAGKTGTTDDTRDSWFVGYTGDLLALVWVGYDDNRRTGLTGSTGALPIWVDLMRRAGSESGRDPVPRTRGIRRVRIDPLSGQLATRRCPATVDELFIEGSEPLEPCLLHERKRLPRWLRRLLGKEPKAPRGDV
jgi:penicillin-binding protein 1B